MEYVLGDAVFPIVFPMRRLLYLCSQFLPPIVTQGIGIAVFWTNVTCFLIVEIILHQFVVNVVLGSIWTHISHFLNNFLSSTLCEILCIPFLAIYLAVYIPWMCLRFTLRVLCLPVEMFRSPLGSRQVFNQRVFELGEFLRSKPILKLCETVVLFFVDYTPLMLEIVLRQWIVYLRNWLSPFLYQALGSWYPFEPPPEDGQFSENPYDWNSGLSENTERIVLGYGTCTCGVLISCCGGTATFLGLLVLSCGIALLSRSWRLRNVHVEIPSSSEPEESRARQQGSKVNKPKTQAQRNWQRSLSTLDHRRRTQLSARGRDESSEFNTSVQSRRESVMSADYPNLADDQALDDEQVVGEDLRPDEGLLDPSGIVEDTGEEETEEFDPGSVQGVSERTVGFSDVVDERDTFGRRNTHSLSTKRNRKGKSVDLGDLSTDEELAALVYRMRAKSFPWTSQRSWPVPDSPSWDDPKVILRSNDRRYSLGPRAERKAKQTKAKWRMSAEYEWKSVDK
ncbi:uncharacterized protein LOC135824960 [Sycon ciliatum]|uniref:uncharacterized protein LOC135824960 n=1 Tax=Sycon ciliatum TaxID=27933 RepID=UPI0031F711CA